MNVDKVKTLIQWIRIYHLYHAAFPASEKKPFSMIVSMHKKGKSDVWYCEKDGKFSYMVLPVRLKAE